MKYVEEYRNPGVAREIADRIKKRVTGKIRLMEVCGTHTMSIFRHGIRSLLPDEISLISGPGCPVCVTAAGEIDAFIELAGRENVIITTFGDLIRVPGSNSSLGNERASGGKVQVVASALDALATAKKNPDKKIVFPGVGFETTAPTIAGAIIAADAAGIDNFFVYSAHKLVPPALEALMGDGDVSVNGFLLPGHVSMVIGLTGYEDFFEKHPVPCAVAGFEPTDILAAVLMLVEQMETGKPFLGNTYDRVVSREGNKKAREVMYKVFQKATANWRGIGEIPESGLRIRKRFEKFDAAREFDIRPSATEEPKGCSCGDILKGLKIPPDCPLYKKRCTPAEPVGPCMVSTEGTCAAYYRYT